MKNIKIGPYKDGWNVEGNLLVIDKKEGFNFGYVIYIPNTIKKNTTIIVEGSNCSSSNENFEMAQEVIYKEATHPCLPIYEVATKLGLPILYPLFPSNQKYKEYTNIDISFFNKIK